MKLFKTLEFADGRILQIPCSVIYRFDNFRFGPAVLLLIPYLVGAGAAIYSGIAARREGESAAAMEEYNAKVAEQEAKQIEKRSEYEQQRQTEEAARTMGTLAAGLSASGAIPSEGTPLLLQAKQASELELENLMIGYEGMTGAARARSQAKLDKMQAKLYQQKGRNQMIGSFAKAGSTLLTGFNEAGMFNKTTNYNPSMYSGYHQV